MAEATPKRAAEILDKWLWEIKRKEKKNIPDIEEKLGDVIGVSGSTIESWRGGRRRPDLILVVSLAKAIVQRLAIVEKEKFFEFLSGFGYPNPSVVWEELFPSRPLYGPEPVEHFVGRDKEIQELIEALQPGQVVTLCGPGGVGKTALISEVLKELISNNKAPKRFPDGIFFHDFYEQPSADDALEQIYRTYVKDELPRPTPRDAARRALANKHVLLVLDGAEEADDLDKMLGVRDRDKCGVLVITRYRNVTQGKTIYLDVLPLDEAIIVLRAWSTQDQTEFQVWSNGEDTNLNIAKEICGLVGRLPLALRLAGRYMQQCTTASVFVKLLQESELSVLEEEKRQHRSVPVLLAKSVEKVSEGARKILSVVGILSQAPVSSEEIAFALGRSLISTQISINELVRFSLLLLTDYQKYQAVHRLILTYAKCLSAPDGTVKRLAEYYSTLAKKKRGRMLRSDKQAQIVAIVVAGVDQKDWESVLALTSAADHHLYAAIYHFRVNSLSFANLITVRAAGLEAARSMQDRQGEARFLVSLGLCYIEQEEWKKAIEYCYQAEHIFEQLGNTYGLVVVYSCFSLIYTEKRDRKKVVEYCQLNLTLLQQIGNQNNKDLIGKTREELLTYFLGRYQKISESYQQAIVVAQKNMDHYAEGDWLCLLGYVYYMLGLSADALELSHKLLELENDPNNTYLYNDLTSVYFDLEKLKETAFYYAARIENFGKTLFTSSLSLGVIALYQDDEREARLNFETVLGGSGDVMDLEENLARLVSSATMLEYKAVALLGVGQVEEAITTLKEALAKRLPGDTIKFTYYDLMAELPNPPPGLDRMRRLLEEALYI